jgi:hypothetical protein
LRKGDGRFSSSSRSYVAASSGTDGMAGVRVDLRDGPLSLTDGTAVSAVSGSVDVADESEADRPEGCTELEEDEDTGASALVIAFGDVTNA